MQQQQQQMDMVMRADKNIFSSPTGTSLHYQVKHSFNLTPRAPLPNGSIYHRPILEIAKYKQRHDQHQVPHKFHVGDKVWLHLQKECLTRAYQKLRPLRYGPYTSTKAVGNNALEHSIPPFIRLHQVFNVDRRRPSFPPLLDTLEVAEQLTRDQVQQKFRHRMEELNAMGTIAS